MNAFRLLGLAGTIAFAAAGFAASAKADDNYATQKKSTPGCPGISYQFRAGTTEPYGYVWFNDLSGVSRATGTLDKATGAFKLTLVSIDKNGPTGTVEGVRGKDGSLKAVLKGPGCSNGDFSHAKPTFQTGDSK